MEFKAHFNDKLLTYDFWHHASFDLLFTKINWPKIVTATVNQTFMKMLNKPNKCIFKRS